MTLSLIQKNLIRRYLIWAYQSTRESFERIERKTTQLMVDEYVLASLEKDKGKKDKDYQKQVDEFIKYIHSKKQDEISQKFTDSTKKKYHPQYLYFKNRLTAIEGAIAKFLGKSELKKIESLFEAEFTRRILESKDH